MSFDPVDALRPAAIGDREADCVHRRRCGERAGPESSCLETNIRERKKNGDWGKPQARSLGADADRDAGRPAGPRDPRPARRGRTGRRLTVTGPTITASAPTAIASPGRSSTLFCPFSPRPAAFFLRRDPNPPTAGRPGPRYWPAVGTGRERHPRRRRKALGACRQPAPRRRDDAAVGPTLVVPGLVDLGRPLRRFDDAGAFAWVPTLATRRIDRRARCGGPTSCSASCSRCRACRGWTCPRNCDTPRKPCRPARGWSSRRPSRPTAPPVLHVELSFDYDGAIVPAIRRSAASSGPKAGGSCSATRRGTGRGTGVGRGAAPGQAATAGEHKLELKPAQLPGPGPRPGPRRVDGRSGRQALPHRPASSSWPSSPGRTGST